MDFPTQATFVAMAVILVIYYKSLTFFNMAISAGTGCLLYGLDAPAIVAVAGAITVLMVIIYHTKGREGFNTNTPAPEIANTIRRMRAPQMPVIEGYEDVKKEKDEMPAPAKESMAVPFKLGEIPSQVKNGPHIDAASTLVKAINSLNPEQIKAMSKDTQQLIETQKSLMGMLGSMKPMLNDGKELMNTFQDMFGKN